MTKKDNKMFIAFKGCEPVRWYHFLVGVIAGTGLNLIFDKFDVLSVYNIELTKSGIISIFLRGMILAIPLFFITFFTMFVLTKKNWSVLVKCLIAGFLLLPLVLYCLL